MVSAFTAASGNTIDRYFEIEVEGTSNHFHTVLQKSITLHKDVIVNGTVAPTDVTSASMYGTFSPAWPATKSNCGLNFRYFFFGRLGRLRGGRTGSSAGTLYCTRRRLSSASRSDWTFL